LLDLAQSSVIVEGSILNTVTLNPGVFVKGFWSSAQKVSDGKFDNTRKALMLAMELRATLSRFRYRNRSSPCSPVSAFLPIFNSISSGQSVTLDDVSVVIRFPSTLQTRRFGLAVKSGNVFSALWLKSKTTKCGSEKEKNGPREQ